jgi:tetratricopeptide (TPR) repeat protein
MKKLIPLTIVIIGLGVLYPMQKHIDQVTPPEIVSDETLYLSGDAVKRLSMGMEGLMADIYWIRTVQYFGGKLMDSRQPLSSAASANVRMDLLAPLLNTIVALDPHHTPAYRFGAIFLPERDLPAAVALLEKGVQENPDDWRMYQDLGYIYWQAGNDVNGDQRAAFYEKASEWYEKGSQVPGAMWWMHDLAGYMKIEGGSQDAAYAIYSTYLNSDDENIRHQAQLRLQQIQAIKELEVINGVLDRYREQTGHCIPDIRMLAPQLRALNLRVNDEQFVVDPANSPYLVLYDKCKAQIGFDSPIPK